MMVIRDGERVRLISRGDRTMPDFSVDRRGGAQETAQAVRDDGDAVLLAFTGLSDFDGLHSRRHDEEVQLYAFDILALDGDDLRRLPLSLRKRKLTRLLPPQGGGIFIADYEQGESPDLFRCGMQLGA